MSASDSTDLFEPLPVFAYGTLRPEMGNERLWLGPRSRSTAAVLEGFRLYHLRYGFPAIVPGEGLVRGDLVETEDPVALLHALDRLEGFRPDAPRSSHYLRVRVEVALADGRRSPAWTYVYTPDRLQEAADAQPVSGGDWREWLLAGGGR